MTTVPMLAAGMSEQQQAIFYSELAINQKDEVAGVLLALFLGSFGAHHFYLRRTGLGVLYLLFCWTGIPGLVSIVECFFMPSRVQRFNLEQAMLLSTSIRGGPSPAPYSLTPVLHCPACGAATAAGVRFCGRCGADLSQAAAL